MSKEESHTKIVARLSETGAATVSVEGPQSSAVALTAAIIITISSNAGIPVSSVLSLIGDALSEQKGEKR